MSAPVAVVNVSMHACTFRIQNCTGCSLSRVNISYPSYHQQIHLRDPQPFRDGPPPNITLLAGDHNTMDKVRELSRPCSCCCQHHLLQRDTHILETRRGFVSADTRPARPQTPARLCRHSASPAKDSGSSLTALCLPLSPVHCTCAGIDPMVKLSGLEDRWEQQCGFRAAGA